jgi:hypothetical protein
MSLDSRRSSVVFAKILWQPFDVRFANVLKRLDAHQEMLRFELDVLQMQISGAMVENQTSEQQRGFRIEEGLKVYSDLVNQMTHRLDEKGKGKCDTRTVCLLLTML